jgi:group II intron reverse transcriptase/maturase
MGKTTMNGHGKSDRPVVPEKLPNKGSDASLFTEGVEGRGLAKENLLQQNQSIGHRAAPDWQSALGRIRQAAKKGKDVRFTALWHHVANVHRLREEYFALRHSSAPGVDGQTWEQYGQDLEENLRGLSGRLHRGAYHAKPVKRAWIPKSDGRQRPIGIPTLEDKIVQRAAAKVLSCVYETDFVGFSYGFRPRRGPHDGLDALTVGIECKKVNWVLDADIRGFFDTIDHEWLVKFVEHRIADRRVVRHIKKWLNAGVLEDGKRMQMEEGTPQGGNISPLLANIYLHYAFDLWANHWRKTQSHGDVVIVRYADDFVVGFEHQSDARRFLEELTERFRKFNLELHPDKTRLIEFGPHAADDRRKRGQGKPETFDFLGFTHSCSRTLKGRFCVLRQTMRKRMRAKLRAIKDALRLRLHEPIDEVGKWLKSVLTGHYQYYAVPRNSQPLMAIRHWTERLWYQSLRRRSQKTAMTWPRLQSLSRLWLPTPRILHPYPTQRLCVRIQGKSRMR